MSGDEMASLTDTMTALFVEVPCAGASCPASVTTLPANPRPLCDACAARHAANKRSIASMAAFLRTVPPRYGWARLDAPELTVRVQPRDALRVGRQLLHEAHVVFTGGSGSGKTSLAVALVRERVRVLGEPWLMALAFRLGSARIQHKAGDGEALLVERAMRAPFLLLDDLGQETMTATNPIADIIQERDAEQLPTWITTGLPRVEFGQRYGGGVARRVFEQSHTVALGATKRAAAPEPYDEPYDAAARRAGDS